MTNYYSELAHEIWAVAQLAPGEGIADGAARIEALLRKATHPAITHCDNCGCDWLDNGLNPIGCPYCKQPTAGYGVEYEYEYEVWQDGVLQAGGRAADYTSAKSEANHYAMMYAQDGPVEVIIYEKRLLSTTQQPAAVDDAQVPVAATLDEAAAATSEPDADLELIWHSVSDNAETNAAYRRLKARLAALKAEKPTIAVKRDEEIERLAMALRLAEEHINALTPEWYSAGQRVLAEIRAALAEASND